MQPSQSTDCSLWLSRLTKTPPSVVSRPLQALAAILWLEQVLSEARGAADGTILKEGESWS